MADRLTCLGECNHTNEEHEAFDSGLRAARDSVDEEKNPYIDFDLQQAWLFGYSLGETENEYKEQLFLPNK